MTDSNTKIDRKLEVLARKAMSPDATADDWAKFDELKAERSRSYIRLPQALTKSQKLRSMSNLVNGNNKVAV